MKYVIHILLVTTLVLVEVQTDRIKRQNGYTASKSVMAFDETNSIFESQKLGPTSRARSRFDIENQFDSQKGENEYKIPVISLGSSAISDAYIESSKYEVETGGIDSIVSARSRPTYDFGQMISHNEVNSIGDNEILQGGFASPVSSVQFDSRDGYIYEKPKVPFEERLSQTQKSNIPTTTFRPRSRVQSSKRPSVQPSTITLATRQPFTSPLLSSSQKPDKPFTPAISLQPSVEKPSYKPSPIPQGPQTKIPYYSTSEAPEPQRTSYQPTVTQKIPSLKPQPKPKSPVYQPSISKLPSGQSTYFTLKPTHRPAASTGYIYDKPKISFSEFTTSRPEIRPTTAKLSRYPPTPSSQFPIVPSIPASKRPEPPSESYIPRKPTPTIRPISPKFPFSKPQTLSSPKPSYLTEVKPLQPQKKTSQSSITVTNKPELPLDSTKDLSLISVTSSYPSNKTRQPSFRPQFPSITSIEPQRTKYPTITPQQPKPQQPQQPAYTPIIEPQKPSSQVTITPILDSTGYIYEKPRRPFIEASSRTSKPINVPQRPSYQPQRPSVEAPSSRPSQYPEIQKPSFTPPSLSRIPQNPIVVSNVPSRSPATQLSPYRPTTQVPSYQPSKVPKIQQPSYKPLLLPQTTITDIRKPGSIPSSQSYQPGGKPSNQPPQYQPAAQIPSNRLPQIPQISYKPSVVPEAIKRQKPSLIPTRPGYRPVSQLPTNEIPGVSESPKPLFIPQVPGNPISKPRQNSNRPPAIPGFPQYRPQQTFPVRRPQLPESVNTKIPSSGYVYDKPSKPFIESPTKKPFKVPQGPINIPAPFSSSQQPAYRPISPPQFPVYRPPSEITRKPIQPPPIPSYQPPIQKPSVFPVKPSDRTPPFTSTPTPLYKPIISPQKPFEPPSFISQPSRPLRPLQPFEPGRKQPGYIYENPSKPLIETSTNKPIEAQRPSSITSTQLSAYRPTPSPQLFSFNPPSVSFAEATRKPIFPPSLPSYQQLRPNDQPPSTFPIPIYRPTPSTQRPPSPSQKPIIQSIKPDISRPSPTEYIYNKPSKPFDETPTKKPVIIPQREINRPTLIPSPLQPSYGPTPSPQFPSYKPDLVKKPTFPSPIPTFQPPATQKPSNQPPQFTTPPISIYRPTPAPTRPSPPQKPIQPFQPNISELPAPPSYIYKKPSKPFIQTPTKKPSEIPQHEISRPTFIPSPQQPVYSPTSSPQFHYYKPDVTKKPTIPSPVPSNQATTKQKPNDKPAQFTIPAIINYRPTPAPLRPSPPQEPIQPFQPSISQRPAPTGYIYDKPSEPSVETPAKKPVEIPRRPAAIPSAQLPAYRLSPSPQFSSFKPPSVTYTETTKKPTVPSFPSYQPPRFTTTSTSFYRPTPAPLRPYSPQRPVQPSQPQRPPSSGNDKPKKLIENLPSPVPQPIFVPQQPQGPYNKPTSRPQFPSYVVPKSPGTQPARIPQSIKRPEPLPIPSQPPINIYPDVSQKPQKLPSKPIPSYTSRPSLPKINPSYPLSKPEQKPTYQGPGYIPPVKPSTSVPSSFKPYPSSTTSKPSRKQFTYGPSFTFSSSGPTQKPYSYSRSTLVTSTYKPFTQQTATQKPYTYVVPSQKPFTFGPSFTISSPITTRKSSTFMTSTFKPFIPQSTTQKPYTYEVSTQKPFTSSSSIPTRKPFTYAPSIFVTSTYKPLIPPITTQKPYTYVVPSQKPFSFGPSFTISTPVTTTFVTSTFKPFIPQSTTQKPYTSEVPSQKRFTISTSIPTQKPFTYTPSVFVTSTYKPLIPQSSTQKPYTYVVPSQKPKPFIQPIKTTYKPLTYGPSFQPSISTTPKPFTTGPTLQPSISVTSKPFTFGFPSSTRTKQFTFSSSTYKPYKPLTSTPKPEFPFSEASKTTIKPFVPFTRRPSTTQEDRHYLPPKSDGYSYPKPQIAFEFK